MQLTKVRTKMFVLLSSFLYFFVTFVQCSLTTEYYKNLINERTTEALHYELPTRNSEFTAANQTNGASRSKTIDLGKYHFIIVGAGSAGSVLATRLSEIEGWNILVLEAGGEENNFNVIPAMFRYLQFSEMNWGYFSTPQTNCCLGMKDRKCLVPRGKSVGGSGAINALLYVRGNRKDYDKWVELGNEGWSYKEVLPYFIKSENSQIDGDPGYHGKEGVWNVEYGLPSTDTFSNFIEAIYELNQTITDYNGARQIGVGKTQSSMKRGKRQSAATAFLNNARKRRNLKLIKKALVTKLIIDKSKKVVHGIEFLHKNQKFKATAIKEVIVSAGAINSPQLLMLSGIGPKNHLEEMGIDVVEDLPVGKNLQDHPQYVGLSFRTNYSAPDSDLEDTVKEYLNGLGPLTIIAEGNGFLHAGNTPKGVPMINYMYSPPAGQGPPPISDRVFNFNEEISTNYLAKLNSSTDVFFSMILLHPKSRGQIKLKSNNPIDFPNIDLNLFSENEDIDNLIKGIEFVLELTQTKAFRRINATLIDIPICQNFEKYSKMYWECAIRHMSITLYHPCGTTAMGSNRKDSVVNSKLEVHGLSHLRVVDAGVFPTTVSGPINAPVVMIAEKISSLIKRKYLTKYG